MPRSIRSRLALAALASALAGCGSGTTGDSVPISSEGGADGATGSGLDANASGDSDATSTASGSDGAGAVVESGSPATGTDAAIADDGGNPAPSDAAPEAVDGPTDSGGQPALDATKDGPAGADAADGASAEAGADTGAMSDASGEAGAPAVRIVGRTIAGTAGPRFEWSGTNLEARFTGTQVSVQLNDGNNLNEFDVVVDGAVQANLVTRSGTTTYSLATGLADGTHDLVLWRRTEASYGYTEFLGLTGFSANGALLAPPPAPAHQIEIVGDSISCGFGIEGTSSCTNAQLESIENNYLAYGSIAARSLGADVVTIAWSGIGVYRNYNEAGPSTNTMPQRYDYAIPTTTTAWDFSKYQPQAVVINLTSNDFSTMGDPGQPYIDAFVAFVQHIRSKYPGAYFFLVIEWRGNGSDSGPDVNMVVSTIQAGGDSNIESFDIRPYANGSACQGHPNAAGGLAMGNALAAEIQRVLKW